MDADAMRVTLAALNRYFGGDASLSDSLTELARGAAALVAGVRFVGMTLAVDDSPGTYVFTDLEVPEIDRRQYEVDSGPCLTSYRTGETVLVQSTATDSRWPEFCADAAAHGIVSTFSVPLVVDGEHIGAMNSYADAVGAFDAPSVQTLCEFGDEAIVVLRNARALWDERSLAENLRVAMSTRAPIEQAKGIIMAAQGCTPDEAFAVLRDQSQHENVKVRDLAQRIVEDAQRRRR